MSKHERRIVDVRDLFGHEKSGHCSGDDEFSENNNDGDDSPKIVQASNSDVFFGQNAIGKDLRGKSGNVRGGTHKKRQAPAPPVLVDVDVGYLDQLRETGVGAGESGGQLSRQPSRQQPANSQSQSTHNQHDNTLDVNAFMNSYNLNLKDDPKLSLDQSSSGVETDDNATPNGTIDGVPRGGVGKVGKAQSNGYHSAEDSDEQGFEEDEATLEFEEEEESVEGKYKQLYTEYQGEDFSKYLADDGDEKPGKGKRKFKKKKSAKSPVSPTSSSSASSGEHSHSAKSGSGIKTKIGQMFNHSHDSNKMMGSLTGNNIHNFSFSDSRIGNDVADNDLDDSIFGKNARFEKNLQPESTRRTNRISSKRWWNKDTLSAQTLSSHSDILLKARKNSIPRDLDLQSSLTDPGHVESDNISSLSNDLEAMSTTSEPFEDFESYRKHQMYDSKKDEKRSGGKKGFFKKISRSFKKSDKTLLGYYGENATVNPLRQANGGDLHF